MTLAIQRAQDDEERRLRKELEAARLYYQRYRDHGAEIRYIEAQQALDDYLEGRAD